MNEFDNRRNKLFDLLENNSVALIYSGVSKVMSEDAFYPFFANRHFFYLTGIEQENSILMLIKTFGEKKTLLFLDEYNEVKERWTGKRLTFDEASIISGIESVYANNNLQSMLDMAIGENKMYGEIKNVYLDLSDEIKINRNYSTQSYAKDLQATYPEVQVIDVYPLVVELRKVKSEVEVNNLIEAINITNTGISDLLVNLRVGTVEHELADRFEYYGRTHGKRELAFETIIGSGINGTVMHHPIKQQDKVINEGDLVLFDLGYRYKGYSADISRTYPVNGVFSDKQRKVYEAVLNCNKAVINYVKAGLTILDLQNFALEFLKKETVRLGLVKPEEDIKKYYIHNVSHFLGLDTHDVGERTTPLVPGNVITVEPGLYFVEEGIGVRIEDDVLVTDKEAVVLSKGIKKEIDEVERLLKSRGTR